MNELPQYLKLNTAATAKRIAEGLALRPQIEAFAKEIYAAQPKQIVYMGIGGTYASALQVLAHVRSRSALPFEAANAAEFLCAVDRRYGADTVFIFSSVSGTTKEMIAFVNKAHELGSRVYAFIDTPDTPLARLSDRVILSPRNEQLKFFLLADALMQLHGDYPGYQQHYERLEAHLPQGLADIERSADGFARDFALHKYERRRKDPRQVHYLLAAGTQYGAAYSCGMCYWEEQLWLPTRVCHCGEFFHGCLEIIEKDTPVLLFMGEDEQRPLAERARRFLQDTTEELTVLDSADWPLPGIPAEERSDLSHHITRAVCDRIDVYLEYLLQHPLETRRYYRKKDY
ncbi:MAG: SIS domain-containing protein [Erysipelotrichaceae bacterium]|nr:SIS domain-containing protein [Erysipelotrichaceae bacterium]